MEGPPPSAAFRCGVPKTRVSRSGPTARAAVTWAVSQACPASRPGHDRSVMVGVHARGLSRGHPEIVVRGARPRRVSRPDAPARRPRGVADRGPVCAARGRLPGVGTRGCMEIPLLTLSHRRAVTLGSGDAAPEIINDRQEPVWFHSGPWARGSRLTLPLRPVDFAPRHGL